MSSFKNSKTTGVKGGTWVKLNKKVKLVSITGCSNVTGYVNDIHLMASLTHKYGAKILVDAAQLAPHRKINMSGFKNDDFKKNHSNELSIK